MLHINLGYELHPTFVLVNKMQIQSTPLTPNMKQNVKLFNGIRMKS
jgi:hypothetical protein